MKWHVICLVTIFLLAVNPIEHAGPPATEQEPFRAPFSITVSAFHHGDSYLLWWAHLSAAVLAYGACHLGRLSACPGRVTLCRWRLVWRRRRSSSRKKRRSKKGKPIPADCHASPVSASDEMAVQPAADSEPSSEPPVAAEENARVPLRMVLRPGVILTKRGVQLRPMIARLGEDVEEYRALWNDKERFQAAIGHLLHCSCPLCDGKSGFHCVGNDKRSVIPAGSKDRKWFRIQKIECRDCTCPEPTGTGLIG